VVRPQIYHLPFEIRYDLSDTYVFLNLILN
jgi:hypothetical protein